MHEKFLQGTFWVKKIVWLHNDWVFLNLSPKHGEVSIHVEAYDYLVESPNFSIPVVLQKLSNNFSTWKSW